MSKDICCCASLTTFISFLIIELERSDTSFIQN